MGQSGACWGHWGNNGGNAGTMRGGLGDYHVRSAVGVLRWDHVGSAAMHGIGDGVVIHVELRLLVAVRLRRNGGIQRTFGI